MAKELDINGTTIGENTKLSISIKNLIILIGSVVSLFIGIFTYTYLDTLASFEDYKLEIKKNQTLFIKEVGLKIEKLNDRDVNFIDRFGVVEGNIKVILDRGSANRTSPYIEGSVETNPPINR